MSTDVKSLIQEGADLTDRALEALIPSAETVPASIHGAMRHSVFAGGKRLRPVLVMQAAATIGGSVPHGIERLGAAIEMLHTYSLIHDDLPALDNDDLRRGKPTCHVAFGEATAILAGDALQTRAFEILATPEDVSRLDTFGRKAGLAFQIVDDILDMTVDSAHLGKTAGKDLATEKATWPAVYGIEQSQRDAAALIEEAFAALVPYGSRADGLKSVARYLVDRKN